MRAAQPACGPGGDTPCQPGWPAPKSGEFQSATTGPTGPPPCARDWEYCQPPLVGLASSLNSAARLCRVPCTAGGGALTVRVASSLSTVPLELVTTARYLPWLSKETFWRTRSGSVCPGKSAPLNCHL